VTGAGLARILQVANQNDFATEEMNWLLLADAQWSHVRHWCETVQVAATLQASQHQPSAS